MTDFKKFLIYVLLGFGVGLGAGYHLIPFDSAAIKSYPTPPSIADGKAPEVREKPHEILEDADLKVLPEEILTKGPLPKTPVMAAPHAHSISTQNERKEKASIDKTSEAKQALLTAPPMDRNQRKGKAHEKKKRQTFKIAQFLKKLKNTWGDFSPRTQKPMAQVKTETPKPNLPPPKNVRLFNAYRTRTFWTLGKLKDQKPDFTIMIESSIAPQERLVPRVDWVAGKESGTYWGKQNQKIQSFTIPGKALQSERAALLISLRMGAASQGESFASTPDSAEIHIRSLQGTLAEEGGIIYVSHASRTERVDKNWITSWNESQPGDATLSLFSPPGTDLTPLWSLLAKAADFRIETGKKPKGPMVRYEKNGHLVFGVLGRSLPTTMGAQVERFFQVARAASGMKKDQNSATR